MAIVCEWSAMTHGSRTHLIPRPFTPDAIDNPNSFDRVPTYWLPTIRSLGVNVRVLILATYSSSCRMLTSTLRFLFVSARPIPVLSSCSAVIQVPVILIGNKIDLRHGQVTNQGLEDGESAHFFSRHQLGFGSNRAWAGCVLLTTSG